jgi:hypothetical protein
MKKLFTILAVVMFMGIWQVSFADCGNPTLNHPGSPAQTIVTVDPITLITSTTTIPAVDAVNNSSCDGINPMLVYQPWGLTGFNTPQISAGTSVTDEGGVVLDCPKWETNGCQDITKTDYYRNYMLATGSDIKAKGWYFPQFAYWIR